MGAEAVVEMGRLCGGGFERAGGGIVIEREGGGVVIERAGGGVRVAHGGLALFVAVQNGGDAFGAQVEVAIVAGVGRLGCGAAVELGRVFRRRFVGHGLCLFVCRMS